MRILGSFEKGLQVTLLQYFDNLLIAEELREVPERYFILAL